MPTDIQPRQDYRGALSYDTSAGGILKSTTTSSGVEALTSFKIAAGGDFAGSIAQAWCCMRIRFPSGASTVNNKNIFSLDDTDFSGTTGVFAVRTQSGNALYMWMFDEAGVAKGVLSLDLSTLAADDEYFLFWVWDTSGNLNAQFSSVPATRHGACFSWQPGDAAIAVSGSTNSAFTNNAIGCTDTLGTGTSIYYYRIGEAAAGGNNIVISEVAVGNSLGSITEAQILSVALGEKTPMALDGCLHCWALDKRSSSAPAGNEVERIDLVGGSLTLDSIGSGASWTTDRMGDDVDADDPVSTLDFNDDQIVYGNRTRLWNILRDADYDFIEMGDSFGVGWLSNRTGSLLLESQTKARVPIVGFTSGYEGVFVNTIHSASLAEITFTGGTGPVDRFIADPETAPYSNQYLQDIGAVRNGMSNDHTLELYGGTLGAAATSGLFHKIATQLHEGDNSTGTAIDWLVTGDQVALRAAAYEHSGMVATITLQDDTGRTLSGACAMPLWSAGGDPYNDADRTPASGEGIFWLGSDHPLHAFSGSDITLTNAITGIDAGTYAHICGLSVHKMESAGVPSPGVAYISTAVASQSFTGLATSEDANVTANAGKVYSDTQLLNWLQGGIWRNPEGRDAIFMVNIADLNTEANVTTFLNGVNPEQVGGDGSTSYQVGILTRCNWLAQTLGYERWHIILNSNWVHWDSNEADLLTLKQSHLDTEDAYRAAANANENVTVLSALRYTGGAIGWEYSSVIRLDQTPGDYSTRGWPHREGHWIIEQWLPTDKGLTIAGSPTTLLDGLGLHLDDRGSDAIPVWEQAFVAMFDIIESLGGDQGVRKLRSTNRRLLIR